MEAAFGFVQTVFYFVLLIGLVVFVHEAGHFLFAKLFGVKVQAFSIGFGPRLLGFHKGETEYKVAAIPIGGYVKMLGEDPREEILPEDAGRAFGDKPVWQRMLIVTAGPLASMALPLLIYFGMGLTFTQVLPAEAGMVLPGSPAATAGLRPGDVIESVNGKPVDSFDSLVRRVSPRAGQLLTFGVRRGDQQVSLKIAPEATAVPILPGIPEATEIVGRIGVAPAYAGSQVGIPSSTSAAAAAGLETFDKIVEIDGRQVERFVDLERLLMEGAGKTARLKIKRFKADAQPPFQEAYRAEALELNWVLPPTVGSVAELGIESVGAYVAYVKPDGSAARAGLQKGDRLLGLNGDELDASEIFMRIERAPQSSHKLAWQRDEVRFEGAYQPEFIPAEEGGEMGLARDAYDKGFWNTRDVVSPERISNRSLFVGALHYSREQTLLGLKQIVIGVKLLAQGKLSLKTLGGPIMIGQLAGMAGKQPGWSPFFWITALISLNLGLINLLPIPILDGGHVVFLAIEGISRRPVSRRIKEAAMLVGAMMLLLLMLFVTWNDVARIIPG